MFTAEILWAYSLESVQAAIRGGSDQCLPFKLLSRPTGLAKDLFFDLGMFNWNFKSEKVTTFNEAIFIKKKNP